MKKPEHPVQIKPGIHWVGVLNPELKRFDVVMETKFGTSYNSYLVQGSEKTALIDCVKDGFLPESIALVRQLVDPASIDYIVVQHTEPDHSGSIAQLIDIAPQAQVVCSKSASLFLPHITNRQFPMQVVGEGDVLDLGGHSLKFISAPFLHWPDTMFTYDESEAALFTCDAFGCHYAAEHILESRTNPDFRGARRYYYDCIVSPFAPYVTKAIDHVCELGIKIDAIMPSHGPVLDQNPMDAVDLYAAWAKERTALTGNRVFLGYVTCYGYTKMLAERIARQLESHGLYVDMADVSEEPLEEVLERIYDADALVVGSPTLNADVLPPVWSVLTNLIVPIMRGRTAAAFGSYGWSGEAVPMMEARLKNLGCKVAGTMRTRFKPDDAALEEAAQLADKVAEALGK